MTVKCVCGWEGKNGRALHGHQLHCKKVAADHCDGIDAVNGQHDWQMLDLEHPALAEQMAEAKKQGYKKYCDNCGEMR